MVSIFLPGVEKGELRIENDLPAPTYQSRLFRFSYGDIDINADGLRLSDTRSYVNNICTSVDVWGLNIYRGNTFGTLFSQWESIAAKPMFIGEFGTDAFRTTNYPPLTCPVSGSVDEAAQADWDLSLWNDLLGNLSARDSNKVALGGTVFEWSDEWWKVSPSGSQQNCGHAATLSGHPDRIANEEYFGIVDIFRRPRQVYNTLRTAFDLTSQTMTYRAVSAGARAGNFAEFFKNGVSIWRRGGGGGRGFNVAVVDPCTGDLIRPVENFDTWLMRSEKDRLVAFLNALPNNVLVLIAIGDEAGLTPTLPDACTKLNDQSTQDLLRVLESLGSRQIRQYCYWDSWAMVFFKGMVPVIEEQLRHSNVPSPEQASVQTMLDAPLSLSPVSRTFPTSGGESCISVIAAAKCSWATTSNVTWIRITSGASGSGNGMVCYRVDANTGASRTGTVTIDGRTFTVTQEGFNNPVPVLTSLSPSSATAGGSGFTLTVNGADFVSSAIVRWNGSNRTTTFVSGLQLMASIPANDIASPGTASITVLNPSPGGGVSTNALTFTVLESCGTVRLTATPSTTVAGGQLTVSWTAPNGRPSTDWIGLYAIGAPDVNVGPWYYTQGAPTGSLTFVAPNQAGQYEFRYFLRDGFTKCATSNSIAVSVGTYAIAAIPNIVAPGGLLNVSWIAPNGRPSTDWIGFYPVGAPDINVGPWFYTQGTPTGCRTFTVPIQLGQYEFRYFLEDGLERRVISAPITVRN